VDCGDNGDDSGGDRRSIGQVDEIPEVPLINNLRVALSQKHSQSPVPDFFG